MGGERLGFEHLGKRVVFGKGLSDTEMTDLLRTLKEALKRPHRDLRDQ
ncbi:MAG: hypothetical protein IPG10_19950 [Flavobacteriales bacterium]|nr:hypothetical protein [Flavobacteriales bacterium]